MNYSIYFICLFTIFLNSCTSSNPYPNYKVQKTTHMKQLSSKIVEMEHIQSGAQIVLIKNKDQARTFMVGFRTPPYDDTGLFHIFEHAVLAGSRLYPSKSNFFHVANSTVASFVNALTFSVSTRYPFVTRSQEDFDNLSSTYLDAVFFPNVVKDPRIIRREGWRYEVNPDTKKMSINGIVLSEMKGAYSSPYRSLYSKITTSLLPDTPYANESGGLPEKIATLTFEQIRDAHKKYYHPQNSVIVLYGDLDFKKTLKTIDKKFLKEFKKTTDFQPPQIQHQTNFNYPTPVVEGTYSGQKAPNKDFIAKGYVLGTDLSQDEENVANVLAQALISNVAAPLKLRILKEGLAKSTFNTSIGEVDNGLALVFEGTSAQNREKISKVIDEELNKIIKEGLDPKLLTSILNSYEFSFKEKNNNGSHRGLNLGFQVVSNWVHQERSLQKDLDIIGQFKRLRKLLKDQEYVKSFFQKHLLNNQRTRWVVLKPDPDFSKKFNAGLEKQVEQALKDKPIEEYEKEYKIYQEWVAKKEPKEVIDSIPLLKVTDITADEKPLQYTTVDKSGIKVLQYPQDTSGIAYVDLLFDLSGVSEENLKKLSLFLSFLKRTNTTHYAFEELSKEIATYTGGLSFGIDTNQSAKDPQKFRPTMQVTVRFLQENREKSWNLAKEVLTDSQFAPAERVSNLLEELKSDMISSVSRRAPGLANEAATKGFFPALDAFNSEISGSAYENYIMNDKIAVSPLIEDMKALLKNIFNQDRLYLAAITAQKQNIRQLTDDVVALKKSLPQQASTKQNWAFSSQQNYDAFSIPGEVQYVVEATSYAKHGLDYQGSMYVYSRYLNNNYMIPKLREQAGAYGGSSYFTRSGLFVMSTYRDPNLKKSFDIFTNSVDYMKNEKLDKEKLNPAILGALKPYYRDKSVYSKTSQMTGLYLTEQTWNDYMKVKKEILATTPEHIRKISQKLAVALKNSQKAVAGNPQKIKAEASFLKNILSLQ